MLKTLIAATFLISVNPVMALDWKGLWLTPDQQAQQLMKQGDYAQAAKLFTTPETIGTALFLADDFKSAAAVLGRSSSAEAHYNRGNALVMLGEYDGAIDAYQKALVRRPAWAEAEQNMAIAKLRKLAMAPPDDDYGGTGGQLEADEIVFDDSGRVNKSSGEQVIEAMDKGMGEEAMRAMWLRKVETRPADFLAVRFSYQLAQEDRVADDVQQQDPK